MPSLLHLRRCELFFVCRYKCNFVLDQFSVLPTGQGHCGACRKTWHLTDADLCRCDETQTMFHIVESCPLTKLDGGLFQLHSADDAAIAWLTNYGS